MIKKIKGTDKLIEVTGRTVRRNPEMYETATKEEQVGYRMYKKQQKEEKAAKYKTSQTTAREKKQQKRIDTILADIPKVEDSSKKPKAEMLALTEESPTPERWEAKGDRDAVANLILANTYTFSKETRIEALECLAEYIQDNTLKYELIQSYGDCVGNIIYTAHFSTRDISYFIIIREASIQLYVTDLPTSSNVLSFRYGAKTLALQIDAGHEITQFSEEVIKITDELGDIRECLIIPSNSYGIHSLILHKKGKKYA